MTTGAVGKLVARTRQATRLDVFQVQRAPDGIVLFATTTGQVGWWRIRSGDWSLIEPTAGGPGDRR